MLQKKSLFVEFIIKNKALKFGEFSLKSGRLSPYFFNIGVLLSNSENLSKLSEFYTDAMVNSLHPFDINLIYGAAYKGIPLATSIAMTLWQRYQIQVNFAFNRKQAKNYGEGGYIIGSEIKDKVLLIDDVVTAGTTVNETLNLFTSFEKNYIYCHDIFVALDRKEKTILPKDFTLHSIIDIYDIISYLRQSNNISTAETIESYLQQTV